MAKLAALMRKNNELKAQIATMITEYTEEISKLNETIDSKKKTIKSLTNTINKLIKEKNTIAKKYMKTKDDLNKIYEEHYPGYSDKGEVLEALKE